VVNAFLDDEGRGEELTVRLIRHFKGSIRNGELAPGCRLPAERELSQQLGVNRASLRQALKVLQVMGVVNQRVGDGTYLCRDAREVFREPVDFLILLSGISNEELFEFRLLIEPEMAALAAKKASSKDRAEMLDAIAAEENGRTTQERIEADLAFHEGISRAAGSRVSRFILTMIHKAILDSMAESAQRRPIQEVIRSHTAIWEAIGKHDEKAARRAMIRHLRTSRDSVKPARKRSKRETSAPRGLPAPFGGEREFRGKAGAQGGPAGT
jgi:GntR family transcriptional repressor for pyruvate dehydrogenase complex